MTCERASAVAVAAAAFLAHVLCSARYGYFQDELYFIACSQHLALGYPDLPPFAALVARLAAPVGYALPALRLLPALAASLTVLLAAGLAQRFGARVFGVILAAFAVAFMPLLSVFDGVLSTTSFEPLAWTALAWCIVRFIDSRSQRWLLVTGALVGVAAWAKYTIAIDALSLTAAMSIVPSVRKRVDPRFAAGALAIAIAIAFPNIAWQAAHGFPFAQLLHGDVAARGATRAGWQFEYGQMRTNALALIVEAAILANVLAVPLLPLGLAALWRGERWRVLPVAAVVAFVVAIATVSKSYYVASALIVLVAAGAAEFERRITAPAPRALAVFALFAGNIIALPFFLPVLPLPLYLAYEARVFGALVGGGPKQPLYADELEWPTIARGVANEYDRLPSPKPVVYANSYAYASALQFFARRNGLPAVWSADNAFYDWGPPPRFDRLLVVGATRMDAVRAAFARVEPLSTIALPQRAALEGPLPLFLVAQPMRKREELWRSLRHTGV